jgi:hypothetical protein
MNHKLNKGFALLPVLIIGGVILLLSGSGYRYYLAQSEPEQPAVLIEEVQPTPASTPTPTEVAITPTPEPKKVPPKPQVKAAAIVAPVVITSTPAVVTEDVPLIVEQEFVRVFGRQPTAEESSYWKERYRKNSGSREYISSWLQADYEKRQQLTSVPVPKPTSVPTPEPTPTFLQQVVIDANKCLNDPTRTMPAEYCMTMYGGGTQDSSARLQNQLNDLQRQQAQLEADLRQRESRDRMNCFNTGGSYLFDHCSYL